MSTTTKSNSDSNNGTIQIKVLLFGEYSTLLIEMPLNETVFNLKERITKVCESHPEPSSQKLIHCGKCLVDTDKISDVFKNVTDPSISTQNIHLILRKSIPLVSTTPTFKPPQYQEINNQNIENNQNNNSNNTSPLLTSHNNQNNNNNNNDNNNNNNDNNNNNNSTTTTIPSTTTTTTTTINNPVNQNFELYQQQLQQHQHQQILQLQQLQQLQFHLQQQIMNTMSMYGQQPQFWYPIYTNRPIGFYQPQLGNNQMNLDFNNLGPLMDQTNFGTISPAVINSFQPLQQQTPPPPQQPIVPPPPPAQGRQFAQQPRRQRNRRAVGFIGFLLNNILKFAMLFTLIFFQGGSLKRIGVLVGIIIIGLVIKFFKRTPARININQEQQPQQQPQENQQNQHQPPQQQPHNHGLIGEIIQFFVTLLLSLVPGWRPNVIQNNQNNNPIINNDNNQNNQNNNNDQNINDHPHQD